VLFYVSERAVVLSYVKRLKGDFKTGKGAAESLQSPITTQGWGKGHRKWLDGPEGKKLMMERNAPLGFYLTYRPGRKFSPRCLRSESGPKNTQKHPVPSL
jgi:hypothetical protein